MNVDAICLYKKERRPPSVEDEMINWKYLLNLIKMS